MKVLLLSPPKKVPGLNYLSPPVYNLGFLYMAAVLEKAGFEVALIDGLAEGFSSSQIISRISGFKPDLVGITATTPTANSVLDLCVLIKKELPATKIVLGGPHFSFLADTVLQKYSEIDYICRGEAEYTIRDLVTALEHRGSLNDIAGLSFRDNLDQVIHNPDRGLIEDLDSLPFPAYHLIDMTKYGWLVKDPVSVTVSTSRGCLGGCNFCNSYSFWGRRWRPRSPESVFSEIEFLVSQYDAKFISFSDECFTWDIPRMERFFDIVIESRLNLKFYFQARLDHIVQLAHILPKLRQAGVILIFVGLESADEMVLKSFNKNISLNDAGRAFDLLRTNGILSWASLIVGGPNDSPKTFQKNQYLIESTKPDFIGLQTYCVFPGTKDPALTEPERINWDMMDGLSNFHSSTYLLPLEVMLYTKLLRDAFPDSLSEGIPPKIYRMITNDL